MNRSFKYLLILNISLLIASVSNTSRADGFISVQFSAQPSEKYTNFSRTCGEDKLDAKTLEIAELTYHVLIRDSGFCIEGVRGNYCATYVISKADKVCRFVFYTKWNSYTADLSDGPGRVSNLMKNTETGFLSPVAFEANGGTVALSESENFVEIISIE